MHRLLKLTPYSENPSWVILNGQVTGQFKDFIAYRLRPLSTKRFSDGYWRIYWTQLRVVVEMAQNYFGQVDWSALSDNFQAYIVGAEVQQETKIVIDKSAWEVLHLQPSAPPDLIKAAYKVLARLHHPDVGGNPEEFRKITEAYESLITK